MKHQPSPETYGTFLSHAYHNGQNTARVTSYFKSWYVRRMGLGHCDEILCGRITNTGKVCAGNSFRANAKVGSEGKTRRIWISSRWNQGTSHFINVVFKPRRTTAEQRNVVYFFQRPSSMKQVCCCHWSGDKEEHFPTERTMFWLFKEWSHQQRLFSQMLSLWRETSFILVQHAETTDAI